MMIRVSTIKATDETRIFDEMHRLYDSLVARHFLHRTQL